MRDYDRLDGVWSWTHGTFWRLSPWYKTRVVLKEFFWKNSLKIQSEEHWKQGWWDIFRPSQPWLKLNVITRGTVYQPYHLALGRRWTWSHTDNVMLTCVKGERAHFPFTHPPANSRAIFSSYTDEFSILNFKKKRIFGWDPHFCRLIYSLSWNGIFTVDIACNKSVPSPRQSS